MCVGLGKPRKSGISQKLQSGVWQTHAERTDFDATKRELAVGRKSEFFKFTPHILGGGNLARKFCGNPLIWRICDIQYFAGKKSVLR